MLDRIIFLALGLMVNVVLGQELVLKPPELQFSKPLGSSMVITCSVSQAGDIATNPFVLHWIDHNNQEVTAKSGKVYTEDEGTNLKKLYVTSIRATDAGMYTCRSKINGLWQAKSIQLTVFKEITFDDAPFVQNPALNTDALIRCQVSGIPTPQVSWRYDSGRIHYGERFIKEDDGLRIHRITEMDNGNYTCKAEVETDGRYDERTIEVIVHIPPKITFPLTVQEGIQGTDLAMTCRGTGLPAPLYEFFKDNGSEPVASTSRIHVQNSTGNIYFSPVSKEDEGKYTCRVSNGAGEDTTVGELRVFVPPLIEPLGEVEVNEGEVATIECRSQGDPAPDMTFHSSNLDIRQSDDGRVIVTHPADGVLMVSISNVAPNDAGDFICRARSKVGSDERTGALRVLYRPRFDDDQQGVAYIWAGKTQNITCNVSSMPEPNIEWMRSGTVLSNNDTFHVYSLGRISYLQVRVREADQGWIYGLYSCKAKNSLGEAEKVINLQRASVPDAPESVDIIQAFPTTVILKAVSPEEDGGMSVTGYRVEYEDRAQDFLLGDEIRIDSLKPSTTYIFRVRAKNEVGIGLGNEISVTTAAIRQPYPIQITSPQLGTDAYEYVATWNPPVNGGLPITEFKFSYRKVSVEKDTFNISQPLEDWSVYMSDDLPLHYYRLEYLNPVSYYELEIRTRNSIGWSEPNKQFVFLTADDPFATTSSTLPEGTQALLSSPQTPTPYMDTPAASAVSPATDADAEHPNVVTNTTGSEGTDSSGKTGNIGSEASHIAIPVVTVVVIIFLLFLVIVDISCYFMNNCGITKVICVNVCGRERQKYNEKGMAEGESDKKPLSDEGEQEMEPLAAYRSGDSDFRVSMSGSEPVSSHQQDDFGSDPRQRLKNVVETDEREKC